MGASGFIGAHLYSRLGPERALATYHRAAVPGGVYFDAGHMKLADSILRGDHGLTHAFLLHGIGKLDECARDPAGTAKVNVEGMQRTIDELAAAGIKIIFTSSDAVFDGSRGSWTEDDPTHPVLTYGRQKVAVEQHLMRMSVPWVIARLSKVVGADPGDHSLFGEWIRKIQGAETIRCARDLTFAPIHVEDVVTALIGLAREELTGVYNVCGPRSMTRLDLLEMFAAEVSKHSNAGIDVVPCSIRDFPFLEPRPIDGSMRADKLYRALGIRFQDMELVCARIAREEFGAQDRAAV
jgi:dTDP-4-dehydrorhamnose reductase